jgi:hypothetical protein
LTDQLLLFGLFGLFGLLFGLLLSRVVSLHATPTWC